MLHDCLLLFDRFDHFVLLHACLVHCFPALCVNLSAHLVLCLPMLRLPVLGSHIVTLYVHRVSRILATWPPHYHLRLSAASTAFFMPVLVLRSSFLIQSFRVTCIIFLSIFLWQILIFCSFLFSDHVWLLYSSTGSTHFSNTCTLRLVFKVLSVGINFRLQNFLQAWPILLLISFSLDM